MSSTDINEEIDHATPETVAEWFVSVTADDQLPCDKMTKVTGKSCLVELDINYSYTRRNFEYVARCCSGCRAHWFAQMARNAIYDHKRSR